MSLHVVWLDDGDLLVRGTRDQQSARTAVYRHLVEVEQMSSVEAINNLLWYGVRDGLFRYVPVANSGGDLRVLPCEKAGRGVFEGVWFVA